MIVPKFRGSQSTAEPPLLDTFSSESSVYIRRNIREVMVKVDPFDEESEEMMPMYNYEEAVLSKEEYSQYESEQLNEVAHTEQEVALAELSENVDSQNTENLLALSELGDQLTTDLDGSDTAIAEAYEDLAGQIAALEARIAALEG